MQNKSFIVLESVNVMAEELGCIYIEATPVGVVVLVDLFNFQDGENYKIVLTDIDGHLANFDFNENYVMRKLVDGFDIGNEIYVEIYIKDQLVLRGFKKGPVVNQNKQSRFYVNGEPYSFNCCDNEEVLSNEKEKEVKESNYNSDIKGVKNRLSAEEWAISTSQIDLFNEAINIINKVRDGRATTLKCVCDDSAEIKDDKSVELNDGNNDLAVKTIENEGILKSCGDTNNNETTESSGDTGNDKMIMACCEGGKNEEFVNDCGNVNNNETTEYYGDANNDEVFTACGDFGNAEVLNIYNHKGNEETGTYRNEGNYLVEDNLNEVLLFNKDKKRVSFLEKEREVKDFDSNSKSGYIDGLNEISKQVEVSYVNHGYDSELEFSYFDTIKDEFDMLFAEGDSFELLQKHFGGEWRKVSFGSGLILAKISLSHKNVDFPNAMPDIVALAMPCIVNETHMELGKNSVVYKLNNFSDFGYNILFQDARNGKAIKIMENKC